MPLFPAFLQLVLKAEGIRSNPNFPLPKSSSTSHGWSSVGCSGEQKNWQAEVGDCLSDLVIPLRGSHQASRDMSRPRPRPTWTLCRALDSAKGKSVYNCLIWSHSVCIPGVALYMKSNCATAFPFFEWSAYPCNILSNIPFVLIKMVQTKIILSPQRLTAEAQFPVFHQIPFFLIFIWLFLFLFSDFPLIKLCTFSI